MRFYYRPATVSTDYADGSWSTEPRPGFHVFGACCDESHEWYATEEEAQSRVAALTAEPALVGL